MKVPAKIRTNSGKKETVSAKAEKPKSSPKQLKQMKRMMDKMFTDWKNS